MNGRINIQLSTAKVTYDLTFDHNISIIRGDSGTGKSLLCELISDALAGDETVNLALPVGVSCLVMPELTINSPTTRPWYEIFSQSRNTVIFIDEGCDCLHSSSFSKTVKHTANYYVIISRNSHTDLPYSVNAIYTFNPSQGNLHPVIVNKQAYPHTMIDSVPTKIITEDKGAGYSFFQHLYSIPVVSMGTKTNAYRKLKGLMSQGVSSVLAVVDGAAFGPEIENCMRLIECSDSYHIYFPESFEWIILQSINLQGYKELQNLVVNYLYTIDWSKNFSVERYFTHILEEVTRKLGLVEYDKSADSLDPIFLTDENLMHIRQILPFHWDTNKES